MKNCTKCKIEKSLSEFSKNGQGLRAHCKACMAEYKRANKNVIRAKQREWTIANSEKVAADKKAYRQANKDKVRAYKAAYNLKNKESIAATRKLYNERNRERNSAYAKARYPEKKGYYAEQSKKWGEENKGRRSAINAKRRAGNRHHLAAVQRERKNSTLMAIPGWADLEAIAAVYIIARSQPSMHVDHIVPLKSKLVCGLHCEANLRIIPASENISKGNRHWPDMPE